ncbi:protein ELYS-like [Patiria miniata]|uniref:Uncharacterized protein n=1 Tax=Patiria miniata TaxID=46514 RepID=A0A914BL48_PATMI|nr:protein ELYS-like [Patiria miniata]XP_038076651.1 protein ELYS-like [Patiria miniata]
MALQMNAHWTSNVQPLGTPTLAALQDIVSTGRSCMFGGCASGGQWSWLARHSVLEVVDNVTGNRRSAFQFGRAVGANGVQITCVKEYRCKGATNLIVGLKTGSNDGMLCIFDPHTSKVVLAVDIPQGVTAVEPVTSVGGLDTPSFALGEHLRLFFGIIAVGTEGGHTYLVDLRLDDSESCDEVTARGSKVISPRSTDIGTIREKAARKGEHLCLHLDEDSHSFRSFSFRKPDHSVLKSFYPSEVSVTSLSYLKQTGTLAIGFSFGCFQLWELSVPVLEYSSTLSKQSSPVTHFAYQEPEDDPENFSYLWVGRGPQAIDVDQEVPTNLHLFQLMYAKKEVHENYGHLYRELISCEARFLHDLTLDPFNVPNRTSEGSRIISCFPLVKEIAPGAVKHEDSMCGEDEGERLDLGLAAFVWEARSDPADGQESSSCFLALFDLNRWYHAQMPRAIRTLPGKQGCSFFAFYSLESIIQAASPDFLTDLHINPSSIVPYVSSHIPAPEQHFQPSALSFNVTCLMEAGLVNAKFLGQQKQVLADLCQQGPPALREPKLFFNRCWLAGLLPKRSAADQGPANATAQGQREALLTVAVEHNMLGFVIQCINSWTHGDFPSGCNLRTILDWAWGLVTSIKQSIDNICIPLYNGEGTHVDDRTRRLLDQNAVRLGHMITIIQSLLDQSATTTEQGLKDLETKCNVVMLIHQHLKAVIWFVRSGLLPECHDESDLLEGQFYYPAASLRKIYARRRLQLQKLCLHNSDSDILMIDGLVSEIGSQLTTLWDRKEEGGTGLYPPPSFHALLDMYLVDTVPVVTKHCIVGYFLMDILHVSPLPTAQKEELGRRIDKFCQSFSLPLGVTKLLHGFSLLDRKEFEDAIDMLLDPTTTLELAPWQHRHIIKAFLYQNESKKALQYVRTARPPLTTRDDVKLYLTVLLANGLTSEAFHFQRRYRDEANTEELLAHLILGSQQTKTVDQLLKLPFDDEEEAILERYLQDSTEPNSQELLIMHFLQRARYVEAIRLNEKLKQQGLMADPDPAARERATARNAIVESYARLLPPVQRRLAFSPETSVRRSTLIRREISRPKPLSAVVNPAKTAKVLSNAMLINAVLDRIAEARAQVRQDETPTKMSVTEELEDDLPTMEPFVGTPITPRTKSTFGDLSSVIYPEVVGREVSPWKRQPSPTKTRPFLQTLSADPSLRFTDKFASVSKAPRDYTSASALSLLQTPPVMRRTPSKLRSDGTPATRSIPSILKVRSTSQRIPTEAREEKSKKKTLRTKFEVALPTPPSLTKSSFSKPLGDQSEKPLGLPKRISFAEDTKARTPSPVMVKFKPSPEEEEAMFDTTPPLESPSIYPDLEVELSPFLGQASPPLGEASPPMGQASPPLGEPSPPHEQSPYGTESNASSDQSTPPVLPRPLTQETPEQATTPGGFDVSLDASPSVRTSPPTEKFEITSGMGMLVDDEITFNFGPHQNIGGETDMEALATTDEESPEKLQYQMPWDAEVVDEDSEKDEPPVEQEELDEVEEEEEELRPLSESDLIPSPRPPLRRMAPDTATPRSSILKGTPTTSRITPSQLLLRQPSPSPPPAQEEEDFVTPQQTPEKPETEMEFPSATPPSAVEDATDSPSKRSEEAVEDFEEKLGAESVEIQTSPMDLLPSTDHQEMSVQTTPGLALRQGGARPARVPFEASLVSSLLQQEPMTPPTSGEEMGGESSSEQVASQDEGQTDADTQPSEDTDVAMETSEMEEAQVKEEQVKQKQGRKSTQSTPALSFIFSPPHTRSRTGTRRHARKVIDEVTTPLARPTTHTALMPSVGPTPSLDLIPASIGGGTQSMGATPSSVTGTARRGRRSHTPKVDIQEAAGSTRGKRRSVTPVVKSEQNSDLHGPVTRSRRSQVTPRQSPTDSPVALLSPLEEGMDTTQTTSQTRSKRVVRIAPHSMTLRTPRERKTQSRNVKLW